MEKAITIAEVRQLAQENYDDGGDAVVECWTDADILNAICDGLTTPALWVKSFREFERARFAAQQA